MPMDIEDLCGRKRSGQPIPQEHEAASDQDVPSQKRYNTRATRINTAASRHECNLIPIRIRPPTHSLHFQRLHKLFFNDEEAVNDGHHQNDIESTTSIVGIPPIVRFGNVRFQQVYSSPHIYIVDQFLSATDVQYLFTHFISKFKFQRSFIDEGIHDDDAKNLAHDDVAATGSVSTRNKLLQQAYQSPHRTSTFLALNKQHDSRISSIEQKVASLFSCSTKQIEGLQLVRYQSPNQFFNVHHDLGIYDESTGTVELPKKSIWYHRRMVSIFCYLNTVPSNHGGATYFPRCTSRNTRREEVGSHMDGTNTTLDHINPCNELGNEKSNNGMAIDCSDTGLRIYPVAGRAVVFSNVLPSGKHDDHPS
jgi:hypothetical protein